MITKPLFGHGKREQQCYIFTPFFCFCNPYKCIYDTDLDEMFQTLRRSPPLVIKVNQLHTMQILQITCEAGLIVVSDDCI